MPPKPTGCVFPIASGSSAPSGSSSDTGASAASAERARLAALLDQLLADLHRTQDHLEHVETALTNVRHEISALAGQLHSYTAFAHHLIDL